ncbi:MAG: PTS system mannose/fructose/N-acetylgalactosamine-transporter subunit IIB [Erysipelotrichaceae bacterium]
MANIVNVRIDERLIHGQVAAFWTNNLNASRLMVIDDLAAKDEIQKMALKMACPTTVKLSILTVDRAVERLNDASAYEGERVFVVIKGTHTLKAAVEKGVPFNTITVGNMSSKAGSERIYHSVSVTPDDVSIFREMSKRGLKFIAQMVPNDDPEDFMALISKL